MARGIRLRRNVGWFSLPRNYLEAQFDSLGLEKNRFETGVTDPDSVANTERLTDYADYPTHPEDALEGEPLPRQGDPVQERVGKESKAREWSGGR